MKNTSHLAIGRLSFFSIYHYINQTYIKLTEFTQNFLLQTGVTILKTCAKFHRITDTRMPEKNRRHYFWGDPHITVTFLQTSSVVF